MRIFPILVYRCTRVGFRLLSALMRHEGRRGAAPTPRAQNSCRSADIQRSRRPLPEIETSGAKRSRGSSRNRIVFPDGPGKDANFPAVPDPIQRLGPMRISSTPDIVRSRPISSRNTSPEAAPRPVSALMFT